MKFAKPGKALIACLFALIMMMAFSATAVFAEDDSAVDNGTPVLNGDTFYAKDPGAAISISHADPDNVIAKKVVSTNPKVLAVKKDINEDYGYKIIPKKKGTAKLKVTLKKDGETYKLKAKYTVLPYPNAIQSLVVDGKTIKVTSGKNAYSTPKQKVVDNAVAVTLAQKDGWNIDYAYLQMWNKDGEGDQVDVPVSSLLTGEKIDFPEQYTEGYILINISPNTDQSADLSFAYTIQLKK